MSKRRYKERRIEHRDSDLTSDHREKIGLAQWVRDSRRQSLKGGQAVRARKIESQANLWAELWSEIYKVELQVTSGQKLSNTL